jgi:flagellar export protein FliJ
MARYEFRLETVRKVREAARDQRRLALAEAFRAAEMLASKRHEVSAEQAALREVQRSAAAGRYLDVNRLVEAQRYELLLKARDDELAKQSALVAAEIERRRQQLVEADREVRVLELLDERHRREHARRQARLETKQLDEAAILQWSAK